MTRRALTHRSGGASISGDREAAEALRDAFAAAERDDPDTLTHGFHSYPARMHPSIAKVVIERLGGRNGLVVDPFCGSGTVLVEAMIAGRPSLGTDLSPIALRLARLKTRVTDAAERAQILELARSAAERSFERVRGRVPIQVAIPRGEARFYDGHVLKEVGGLLHEIRALDAGPQDVEALEMVLSAILIKVSRQRADTAERATARRIRKGLATELFLRKAEELAARWKAFADALPRGAREPEIRALDARRIAAGVGRRRAALVLTSPPYVGTYDYAEHHARREAFLGLDARALQRREIGSRRGARRADALARWDDDIRAVLEGMVQILDRGALAVLLAGDGQIGRARIDAAEHVARVAERLPLTPFASATVLRPDFTGGPPRREHLLALRAGGTV